MQRWQHEPSDGALAAGTVEQQLTNARQETQIWTSYALSPYLSENDLKFSVHEGNATLTGSADTAGAKELAGSLASNTNDMIARRTRIGH